METKLLVTSYPGCIVIKRFKSFGEAKEQMEEEIREVVRRHPDAEVKMTNEYCGYRACADHTWMITSFIDLACMDEFNTSHDTIYVDHYGGYHSCGYDSAKAEQSVRDL